MLDGQLNDKIAKAIAPQGDVLFEIGPGPGGLSRAILALNPAHLFAIERDRRFDPALSDLALIYPNQFSLIKQDALDYDIANFVARDLRTHPRFAQKNADSANIPNIKIIGNLPFNISTALLGKWLLTPHVFFQSITILVQKEVAQRMVALPKNKDYGRLAILCQWRTKVKILFTLSGRVFTPSPKVDAALVQITPSPRDNLPQPHSIEYVSKMAFQKRRKMLRQSLKNLNEDIGSFLAKADIDPRERAENLSVSQFCQLARLYERGE